MVTRRSFILIAGVFLLCSDVCAVEPDEGGIGGTGHSSSASRPDIEQRPESPERIERIERPEIARPEIGASDAIDTGAGAGAVPPDDTVTPER
jgi:hypothetical protein